MIAGSLEQALLLHEAGPGAHDLFLGGPEAFLKAMGAARRALRRPVDLVDLDEDNAFTRYLKQEGELERVG